MRKIIALSIVIVSMVMFIGCDMMMGLDVAENTPVYWIQPDNTITKSALNTEPTVKYTYKSFGNETTAYSGVIASINDPTSITIKLFDTTYYDTYIDDNINDVSITLIFTANGIEDSITLTKNDFTYDGAGTYSATIWDSSFFPNGIDFYDADGDGVFLDLDTYPNSNDYSILAFESVNINSGTYTWTNPDL